MNGPWPPVDRYPKHVTEVKDIPTEPHFAVLVGESRTYDDGYGERGVASYSTVNYLEYLVFQSIEQVQAWVLEQDGKYGQKPFKVIDVVPCSVQRHVDIAIRRP